MNVAIDTQDYLGERFQLMPSRSFGERSSLNISFVNDISSVISSVHTAFEQTSSSVQIATFVSYADKVRDLAQPSFLSLESLHSVFSQILLSSFTNALTFFQAHEDSQDWFWSSEWQAGEMQADLEIASGLTEQFQSGEAFLQALKERGNSDANL